MPEKFLTLSVPQQEQLNWCWAATTVGIAHYYDPGSALTQCDVVQRKLDRTDCCVPENTSTPPECNVQSGLTLPLDEEGLHEVTYANRLSFDEIIAELEECRPVAVRVVWERGFGGGHFAVIAGYVRDESTTVSGDAAAVADVFVEDSYFGNSLHTYESFRRFYQTELQNEDSSQIQEGRWTHSYLMRPHPAHETGNCD